MAEWNLLHDELRIDIEKVSAIFKQRRETTQGNPWTGLADWFAVVDGCVIPLSNTGARQLAALIHDTEGIVDMSQSGNGDKAPAEKSK